MTPAIRPEDVLTVEDVAATAGVTVAEARKAIETRRLRALMIGGTALVRGSWFLAWRKAEGEGARP